jgi:hypothetical protein
VPQRPTPAMRSYCNMPVFNGLEVSGAILGQLTPETRCAGQSGSPRLQLFSAGAENPRQRVRGNSVAIWVAVRLGAP